MPTYVIERSIPGSDAFTADKLQVIREKSCSVISEIGPKIKWLHSYVTANKWYCIYIAPSADVIYEHARRGGFPADAVHEVITIVDPLPNGVAVEEAWC